MEPRQVVLVKYLFTCAQDKVRENTPISCGLAISLFQDSVELLIRTVGKALDAKIRDVTPFVKMWSYVKEAPKNVKGDELPLTAKMLELNKARVNFKHYGILPDVSESQKFSAYTEEFLYQTTLLFFKVDFNKVSLADLIDDAGIAESLKTAEQHLKAGKLEKCMEACAEADQKATNKIRRILPELDSGFSNFHLLFEREKKSIAESWVEYLSVYLRQFRHFTIAVGLGISFGKYARFHQIVPNAMLMGDGSWQHHHKVTPSIESAQFCVRYVTDYAILVQTQIGL